MQVKDLLDSKPEFIQILKESCNQFIEESGGLPLFKMLPSTYNDFQKVKVRKRKKTNTFSNMFNGAFENELNDLRERSIFATGDIDLLLNEQQENEELFYIIPLNGYKFLYSKEVKNSTENYKSVLESILSQMGEKSGKDVFAELLRFTYNSDNLQEGILSDAEIILYGIPYYYAIRFSKFDYFEDILTYLL